jgi:hypothetical protein
MVCNKAPVVVTINAAEAYLPEEHFNHFLVSLLVRLIGPDHIY